MNPSSITFLTAITGGLLSASALASPRTSAHYNITGESIDAGGGRTSSASYANAGGAGGIGPAETAFVGQLPEVTGFTLTAASTHVNETATLQLGAWELLDDGTFLAVSATNVTWSVQSGPLSINVGGLATGSAVYQNTSATAQGLHLGFTGTLGLTVVNTLPDNFGTYAGDGLDDTWQNQYFGLDNPLAAPGVDPDGDGQTNHFEFTAGLIPTDGSSVFRLRIENVPGQSGQKKLIFSPRLTDRAYTVKAKPSLLTGTFTPLSSSSTADAGQERTVTDLSATGGMKFYTIEITK